MTNLTCNNCGTNQKAKVYETLIPSDIENATQLKNHYLLVIDCCKKCRQKKIYSMGINYLGHFIKYDFLKTKDFVKAERQIIKELHYLPSVCRNTDSEGGWYLYYNEYGAVKKCFSNLSSLKLGRYPIYEDSQEKLILRC